MSILSQSVAALLLVATSLPICAADNSDGAQAKANEKPAAAPVKVEATDAQAAQEKSPSAPAADQANVPSAPAPAPAPKADAQKPAPVRQRLAKQISESYLRLKELRETLADLELAVATGDADKAWENAAQLAILWEALDSKQRISFERRFPGTKARVEKALAEGNILARGAAPRTPAQAKTPSKPAEDMTLAKKSEEKKPVDVEAAPKE